MTSSSIIHNNNNNNNGVRSFVLNHFGKRTQGLLHDCFRILVQIGHSIDGMLLPQSDPTNSSGSLVMTFSASITFIAMSLRLHDRKFALQHALLLSFANSATGAITAEAHRALISVDVETWVNTLAIVLDNTRSSTAAFASALLEEDLAAPNYVAHARAAGRHDAYLEMTMPEVLNRLKDIGASPWARLLFACCSPEVITSLSQRHATIAALFQRWGAAPSAFVTTQQQHQHGLMMSPAQKSNNSQSSSNAAGGAGNNNNNTNNGWSMTTARSRASTSNLPQDTFPVPNLLSSLQQVRKMLETCGTSDSVTIMPQILTVSGFKQIIDIISLDVPNVALNFAEFQLFLCLVGDRVCKFEDASTLFDSGLEPVPAGVDARSVRPLPRAIAGKIHHLIQYLAA